LPTLQSNTCYQPPTFHGTPSPTLLKKFTHAILPRLGNNRHFPRAVVYAPTYFGGLDLLHLPFAQGIAHVLILLRHLRAHSTLGTAFTQALEAYQIHSGLFDTPLQHTAPLSYIPANWINTTREFFAQH
jgi:hypothetical protein